MISRALNALGLVTRAEHEAVKAGFLRDILSARASVTAGKLTIRDLEAELDALRRDANMWRNSLKRSRDRKKGVGK